ncbi:MAG: hypothetical protein ABIA77_04000 [Candidatus Omnitrophota bacterium]
MKNMRRKVLVGICFLGMVFLCISGYAAGEQQRKELTEEDIPFTKEEMLEVVEGRLGRFPEIVQIIKGLSVSKPDEKGNMEYSYGTEDGITSRLADLDKMALYRLFVRVNNEATVINTNRLMQQLAQQQQLQLELQRLQQQQQNLYQQQQNMRVLQQQPPQQPPRPPQQPPQPPPQPPRR